MAKPNEPNNKIPAPPAKTATVSKGNQPSAEAAAQAETSSNKPPTDNAPKEPTKKVAVQKKTAKPSVTPQKTAQNKGADKDKKPSKAPKPTPSAAKNLPKPKAEKSVILNLADLHPFHTFGKHPYQVNDDADMLNLSNDIKGVGVEQPVIVRPREAGGYEIISGHRRSRASELAGLDKIPCIVRNYDDYEAFRAMKRGNNQRDETLPSEKARLLAMELEATKRQGSRDGDGRLAIDIVGENNNMTGKQVQRYCKLVELAPPLTELMDEKKIGFTVAVQLAYIKE